MRQTSIARSRTCTLGSTGEHIGLCRLGDITYRRPMVTSARSQLSHTRRTALLANHPLGSAEITHPFHPRRGQRFVVLKVRRVSGVETLSLRHVELGSFAVPREWTDWAPLDAQAAPTGGQLLLIDAFGLSTLTELVTLLTRNGGLDR